MPRPYPETAPARIATRLVFFVAGFAMACWAPLIPIVKFNLGVNSAQFGMLLFFIGLGSIIAMPISGLVSARQGAKTTTLISGLVVMVILPVTVATNSPAILAAALFVFGASLGTLDVAMNVHGAQIEAREERALMSGFHAQFSIGGLCGAALATLLLSRGFAPLSVSLICSGLGIAIHLTGAPRFIQQPSADPVPFALPRGVVLIIAILTAVIFMIEGAVLDWGALLIITRDLAAPQNAGIGFILFSIAMVIARLAGDKIVTRLGERTTVAASGAIAILGIAVLLGAAAPKVALLGFFIIGLGAANVVPVLFSAAGKQTIMQPALAIASVTTVGYAGLLVGPAVIGVVAEATNLSVSFALLAILALLIPAMSGIVAARR